jgi:RND family efflux transporter MFP subunit
VVRAAGRVEADERRLFTVTAKYEGYIERLLVNTTGQPVAKGQPLFEVYSPELVAAQREYAIAAQGALSLKDAPAQAQTSMQQLADASLARLKNWDLSEDQLQRLRSSGQTQRSVTFRSPVSGVVTEKKAQQGMRFMPGEMLYQVADLSSVWVIADVFEQDLAQVKNGAVASVRVNAYPDKEFKGRIAYVYPSLKAETRTVPVRIELTNPGGLLKPGMFAQMELTSGGAKKVLTVPDSAVIDTGKRSIVLVQVKPGRFEPRTLIAGRRSDSLVEVLQGVSEGEQVVVSANFLIDAESNLKAALLGLEAAPATPAKAATLTGHKAEGKVDSVDAKAGTVTLSHGPVASLKWPAMTMEFKLANPALLKDLQPGKAVAIEFVERAAGEWVITAVTPH